MTQVIQDNSKVDGAYVVHDPKTQIINERIYTKDRTEKRRSSSWNGK